MAELPSRVAAVYARISRAREQQGHGLDAQVHACRDVLRRLAIPLRGVTVYEEEASGRRSDRPVLRKLLHDAAMHRFTVLVVFRLDRLSRGGIVEMFLDLRTLQRAGIRVYSVSEPWWDPNAPTAELILAVLEWAADFESRAVGERVAAGIAARQAEAASHGRPFLRGRARVSAEARDPWLPFRARRLRATGRSWTQVARSLGVSRTTARRMCAATPPAGTGGPTLRKEVDRDG